jgi:predicted TIM-barrel fold metal-dependent hydrolase
LLLIRILEKEGLRYDLFADPDVLEYVPALAEEFPGLKINIHHIAKPEITAGTKHSLLN